MGDPRTVNAPSTDAPPTDHAPRRVLSYEKPLVYRYKSDLPPPGMWVKILWRCCYGAGKLVGLVYRPRGPHGR